MTRQKVAFFRTDAHPSIGSGHLMRCIILAEKLATQNFNIVFLCQEIPENLVYAIGEKRFQLILKGTKVSEYDFVYEILRYQETDVEHKILIIDSDLEQLYEIEFQKMVRKNLWKLMYFTFYNNFHFKADIVLNQNIRGPELIYKTEYYTRLLTGTEYVVLKNDFKRLQEEINTDYNKKDETCLLFFGGADNKHITPRLLKVLYQKPDLFSKIIVVTGVMNESIQLIEKMASEGPIPTEIHINTPQMPALMAEAKYAITSGGLTLWELATLQTLQIVIPTSERERITVEYCVRKDLVHYLQEINETDNIQLANQIEVFIRDNENENRVHNFYNKVAVNGTDKVASIIDEVVLK